ncbi:unnamed protein product [Trichobilharzia szidati]|nr:unnamed protein product [Trichobilharzia szidati]
MSFGTDPRLGYSGMCEDPSVCRDYLRNVCKRGKKCKYKHPSPEECERLRRFDKTFCHDFQNSTCRRLNCKFLHYTKEEEEVFRRTGYLPNDAQWSHRSASNSYDEKTPICKDFANGACNRGANCKYRHVTTQQAQEVVNPTLYNQSNLQEASYVSENTPAAHIDPSLFSNSTHFSQPSLINNAVIVSPTNSVLNPVSNAYIPGVSSHSLMGLISNTSTGQPTLYAHSSLVSITSAPHISPCSSVITVAASPTQHPNVIHPQTALSAPHATYHIVPHDTTSHHHLLATSSSHSQAPTLLTIPLSQFTCNVSNNSLIQSQAAIACSTQHHAVVTGVLPAHPSISSASATYYPSYGVFHINQPPVENCDQQRVTAVEMQKQIHETRPSRCPTSTATETTRMTPVSATTTKTATTSVTSVSSSTTAVLAAAAAAGYIAQHLPVIGSNSLSSGSNISQEHTNYMNSKTGNPSKGVSVHESAIAAAANLPTVSAAAAAAVAAAAAFACSTSMSQNSKYHSMLPSNQTKFNDLDMESSSSIPSPRIITSNNNNNSNSNNNNNHHFNGNSNHTNSSNNNMTLRSNTESCSCQNSPHKLDIHSIHNNNNNNNNNNSNNDYNTNMNTMTACFQNHPHCSSGRESLYSHDNNPNNGGNNNNNSSSTTGNSIKSMSSIDCISNSMPSSSEYLNPADEEQAKTAAAVAAAACIGAIFSQPMAAAAAVAASGAAGVGNSAPSSVAAMLGNLIGCNEKDIMHAVQSSSTLSSVSASASSSSSSYAGASLLCNSSRHNNCSVSNKCDSDATAVINRCPQQQQQQQQQISKVDEKSSKDDHQNEHGGSGGGGGGGGVGVSNNSMDQNNVQSNTFNISSSSSDRCKCTNTLSDNNNPHSLQDTITSDSSNWSSVTTTMASAAKAAAAAAVAATAAVTGSANFFRLTQLKNKVDPQLQSGSSLSSSSSVTLASYLSTSNPSLRCIDQSRNLRLSTTTTTDQMSSSVMVHDDDVDDETELSGCLSTKEAVTMTSAAAAAAMVAAAATVAAEQHQLIGNNFLSEISHSNRSEKQDARRTNPGNSRLLNTDEYDYHRACSSSSSHNDFASPSSYETDSQMYSLTRQSSRYSTKRHKNNKRRATVDCHYADYSSSLHPRHPRHHTNLPRSVDDDYEDDDDDNDDGDAYEDDDVESAALMSPSPEITPPYNLPPSKMSKRDSLLGCLSSYSRGVDDDDDDDSRPASPDPWRPANRKIVISRTTGGGKTDRLESSSSHTTAQSINTPHYANNETTTTPTTTSTTTTTTNPHPDLLTSNSVSSSHVNPMHRHRRSLSTSALSSRASSELVLKVRSKSFPALYRLHSGYQKDHKSSVVFPTSSSSCSHRYISTEDNLPVVCSTGSGMSTSLFCPKSTEVDMKVFPSTSSSSLLLSSLSRYGGRGGGGPAFVKRKLRRTTHRYSSRLSNRSNNPNTTTTTTTATANNHSFLHTNTRRPLTNVSPTSVLSEEGYSGRDDGDDDDADFVDPDYDDDEEVYVFSVPQTSLKRSSSHSLTKYSTKRKRSMYSSSSSSTTTSNVHFTSSASIKQQYALRAENARLRRKLSNVMRQRGDLRAANEMLLEEIARLRQSRRVSVVARIAESATKFIEAHKKSQLAQSKNNSFSSASSAASQSTVPFSIAQAAAAAAVVAAAAQSETNPPSVTGVYVSSPTASIHQHNSPTINAQGGCGGGGGGVGVASSSIHPLFSQIASGNTISTGIAIPSNHALTAVQIQAPIAPPPQATALIHHPQGLHPQQQTGISNYYQHQMNRPIDTLTASIANASVSPGMQNLSQSSSAFQVCHYPVVSIANVFPKLSQDVITSENAKLVPVGVPNTVTLLLGQSTTPQTSTYAIPASVTSHPSVPMQIPVSVGTHLTPTVSSCPPPPHHGGPAKLLVSVAYPHQAAAASGMPPTTSNQYIASNPVNNSNNVQTPPVMPNNHQIQIVHKLTVPHQTTCTK